MSGIILQGIRLKDVGVYKELNLTDLDKQGFVTVTGLNMDSPNVSNNKNGVGKSMMFATIPNLLFEADPLALGKREKTNLLAKGSEIQLDWLSPTGNKISVIQTASKYVVLCDGQDQKISKQDVAKTEWIGKHFPMTSEEFYSYAYIQTQIAHPFQRVRPADRLKYLTDLFDLDIYDRIRASIKQRLDSAKDAETEAKGLADMLEITERKIGALNITKADRRRCSELEDEVQELESQVTKLQKRIAKAEAKIKSAKLWEKLTRQIEALPVNEAKPRAKIKELRAILAQMDAYETYVEDLAEYKEQKADLERKLKKCPKGNSKELAQEISAKTRICEKLEEEIDEAVTQKSDADDYADMCTSLKVKLSKRKPVKRSKAKIEKSIRNAQAVVETYEELAECVHGKDCPTCGQMVDLKRMEKAALAAAAQYKKDKKDLEYIELSEELKELEASPVLPPKESPSKIKARLRKLEDKIGDLNEEYSKVALYDKLSTRLESLRKPKKVEKPKGKASDIERQIEALETLAELQAKLSSVDQPEASSKALTADLELNEKQHTKKKKKLWKLVEEHSELRSRITEHRTYTEQAKELNDKLGDLRPRIEKREMLEVLYKAYMPTALKLRAMEKRLSQIEAKLNENQHLAFPEPMKFKLFSTKSGVGATVTRVTSGQETDISIMSGAETNCFRLLWVPAILPFIPAHRRPNFLVLDEPEDKCSPAVQEHILNNYIPMIRQVVPNVFWITARAVDHDSDSHWTVRKEGGVSTIEHQEFGAH